MRSDAPPPHTPLRRILTDTQIRPKNSTHPPYASFFCSKNTLQPTSPYAPFRRIARTGQERTHPLTPHFFPTQDFRSLRDLGSLSKETRHAHHRPARPHLGRGWPARRRRLDRLAAPRPARPRRHHPPHQPVEVRQDHLARHAAGTPR